MNAQPTLRIPACVSMTTPAQQAKLSWRALDTGRDRRNYRPRPWANLVQCAFSLGSVRSSNTNPVRQSPASSPVVFSRREWLRLLRSALHVLLHLVDASAIGPK